MLGITCCYGCVEKRKELSSSGVNCHMVCESYLAEKAKNHEAKQKKYEYNWIDTYIIGSNIRKKKKYDRG